MAWFLCNVGSGGSGVTLTVTCAEEFAGETITCAKTGKSLTKTCPSSSPYTVEFAIPESGTWTVSATVSGTTYTSDAVVIDLEPTTVLNYGFTWQNWVTEGGLDPTDYSSLSDLLADEEALRRLFLVHASVDYMADSATVTTDLATIINDNYCAKWINLSDYALDTLYANNAIASAMDTADKYFYGEWVITDSTTTPVTWGPKGNVPVMTSDTTPYGTAGATSESSTAANKAWAMFDGNDSTIAKKSASNTTASRIYYKFNNPVNVKKVKAYRSTGNHPCKIQYSDDGSTWNDAYEGTLTEATINEFSINDVGYHLYWALYQSPSNAWINYGEMLQFYGRELSVSVPTMTSATAPYGTVSAHKEDSTRRAYKCFDGTSTDADSWLALSSTNNVGWISYEFPSPEIISKIFLKNRTDSSNAYAIKNFKLQGSNDGSTWTDIGSFTNSESAQSKESWFEVTNESQYKIYRLYITSTYTANSYGIGILQFYGKDYSEKEFEQGTTKKWLYDHGVELESIIAYSTDANSQATKEAYVLKTNMNTTTATCAVCIAQSDLTPYSSFRVVVENVYHQSSGSVYPFLVVLNTATPTGSTVSDAYQYVKMGSDFAGKKGYLIDISSFSTSKYVGIRSSIGSNFTCKAMVEVSELWLE